MAGGPARRPAVETVTLDDSPPRDVAEDVEDAELAQALDLSRREALHLNPPYACRPPVSRGKETKCRAVELTLEDDFQNFGDLTDGDIWLPSFFAQEYIVYAKVVTLRNMDIDVDDDTRLDGRPMEPSTSVDHSAADELCDDEIL